MKAADLSRHAWRNRKLRTLSDAEHRLYTMLLSYCADQENDGRVSVKDIEDVCLLHGHPGEASELARGLQEKGALDPTDEPDAWQVHDWLKHQPSAQELGAYREKMADLGRRGGIRSGEVRGSTKPKNEADGEAPASTGSKRTLQAPASPTNEAKPEAPASKRPKRSGEAHREACREAHRQADAKQPCPALPVPARKEPVDGQGTGTSDTAGPPPTAPPSSDGPATASSSGGARPLPLTKTVARAELLDPSRMARVRDSGGDLQVEACRILDEHAHREREQERAAQEDHRKSLAETLRQNRGRIGLTPHAPSRLPAPNDDTEERKAIAGETFDLDAGDQPGENRA